jgi:hypothetical protein
MQPLSWSKTALKAAFSDSSHLQQLHLFFVNAKNTISKGAGRPSDSLWIPCPSFFAKKLKKRHAEQTPYLKDRAQKVLHTFSLTQTISRHATVLFLQKHEPEI